MHAWGSWKAALISLRPTLTTSTCSSVTLEIAGATDRLGTIISCHPPRASDGAWQPHTSAQRLPGTPHRPAAGTPVQSCKEGSLELSCSLCIPLGVTAKLTAPVAAHPLIMPQHLPIGDSTDNSFDDRPGASPTPQDMLPRGHLLQHRRATTCRLFMPAPRHLGIKVMRSTHTLSRYSKKESMPAPTDES